MTRLFNNENNKFKLIKETIRDVLNKIIDITKSKLIKIKKRYHKKWSIKKQQYTSLAPLDNIKDDATVDMLKKALYEKKNKNIALSGKYGAGKSSIVLSTLKSENKFKPLYISLGMLGIQEKLNEKNGGKDEKNIKEGNDGEEIDEKSMEIISQTIEKSIIQQIIYKEKSNKFPASKIKRISYVNKIITFFIILAIAFYKFEIVQDIIGDFFDIIIEYGKYIFSLFYNNPDNAKFIEFFSKMPYIGKIVQVVLLLVIIYYMSKYIVGYVRKYELKNIKIMFLEKNEIEIENNGESLINKYMDELVYFFEMTNYNVIVIEDLDRFLENDKLRPKILIIFQKLKELNQILNTTKQLQGRKITFLYVVRDDLFWSEEERTKFFDFIVPKIPEISNYNSYARLRNTFKEKEISNKFLQDLSVYIKDYRVIKNLRNEFDLYKQEIIGDGIIKEKLLGMVALKNLRPKDYEELIKEQGGLFEFFKNKKQLYEEQVNNIKIQIEKNKSEVISLEKEKIKNLEDLKYLALGNLACVNSRAYGNAISKSDFLDSSFDIDTIENNTVNIENYDSYYFSEDTLFKSFGGKEEFIKRARKIEKNNNDEIKKLKEKIKQLNNQIDNLKKLSICELLKMESAENIEKLDEFEIMMLKNGYIDENYKNYCFKYEETDEIDRNDYTYILNVRQGKKSNYDYNIEKPQNIILELDKLYFEKQEIWNYIILDTLIKEKNSDKLLNFINTLLKIDENTYDFILGYISFSKNKNEFLKLLHSQNRDVINDIFQYGIQSGENEDELVELLLNIPEILTEENLKNSMVEYIIEKVDFDVCFELNEKVKESFILLEIEFSGICDVENNYELLEFIYNNNLYELNSEMIKSIFVHVGFKSSDFEQKCLSLILKSSELEKLKLYVLENKEEFIRKCFIKTNGIGNSTNDLIECLNTWEISYEVKNLIVNKIYEKIDDVSKVKDTTIYSSILCNEKMEVSWENIYNVYCVNEQLTEELIKYIEKNIDILVNKKLFFDVSESEKTRFIKFRDEIGRSNNINFDVYKKLIRKLNISISHIEENEIEDCRLEVLIKEKILILNKNTFDIIGKQKIEFLAEFVNLNIDNFVSEIDEMELNSELLERIIVSDQIKYRHKTTILLKIDMELLSKKTIKFVIDNYKQNGISVISEEMKKYFLSSDIDDEIKILLLNNELSNKINETKIIEYISYLPEDYCKIGNINYPQVSILKTKLNEELVNKLKSKINISLKILKNKIVIYNKKR